MMKKKFIIKLSSVGRVYPIGSLKCIFFGYLYEFDNGFQIYHLERVCSFHPFKKEVYINADRWQDWRTDAIEGQLEVIEWLRKLLFKYNTKFIVNLDEDTDTVSDSLKEAKKLDSDVCVSFLRCKDMDSELIQFINFSYLNLKTKQIIGDECIGYIYFEDKKYSSHVNHCFFDLSSLREWECRGNKEHELLCQFISRFLKEYDDAYSIFWYVLSDDNRDPHNVFLKKRKKKKIVIKKKKK